TTPRASGRFLPGAASNRTAGARRSFPCLRRSAFRSKEVHLVPFKRLEPLFSHWPWPRGETQRFLARLREDRTSQDRREEKSFSAPPQSLLSSRGRKSSLGSKHYLVRNTLRRKSQR